MANVESLLGGGSADTIVLTAVLAGGVIDLAGGTDTRDVQVEGGNSNGFDAQIGNGALDNSVGGDVSGDINIVAGGAITTTGTACTATLNRVTSSA